MTSVTRLGAAGAFAAAVLVLAMAGKAEAQRHHRGRIDGARVDVHLDLGWYQAFGLGFRVDIPIVDSIIDEVDDELALSPGAELFFWDFDRTFVSLWPVIALQWNFYLSEKWSVFPELGLSLFIGDDRYYAYGRGPRGRGVGAHIWPFLGVGGRYHWNDRNSLIMRINWPAGLQIGITF